MYRIGDKVVIISTTCMQATRGALTSSCIMTLGKVDTIVNDWDKPVLVRHKRVLSCGAQRCYYFERDLQIIKKAVNNVQNRG